MNNQVTTSNPYDAGLFSYEVKNGTMKEIIDMSNGGLRDKVTIIELTDLENKRYEKMIFLYHRNSSLIRKFLIAMNLSNQEKRILIRDLIGKKVWVAWRREVTSLEPYRYEVHPFDFFHYTKGGKKPSIMGDPENNDGVPDGEFIKIKKENDNWEKAPINF